MQLNAVLRNVPGSIKLQNMTSVVLPLLWVEEEYVINGSGLKDLDDKYLNKVTLYEGLKWGLIALSLVLVLIFAGVIIHRRFFISHKSYY